MPYKAPLPALTAALDQAGLQTGLELGLYGDLSIDLASAVLSEAAKFADTRLAPLNKLGDAQGVTFESGRIRLPDGWAQTYQDWCAAGWNALVCPPQFGGQGLPQLLNAACTEMWNSACMAFGLCPMLTMSAIEALHHHGTDELKNAYLAKLVSGEWTGSMQLTEPQAGSDLAALRMQAKRSDDGSYRLFGQKIYITYGDHEMTDNIVHFILARIDGAPPGIKGLSLFLAPKFMVGADGALGARNDIHCSGIEHKLGIHAAPTCTMVCGDAGGAVAYLVGEENRGINCMFTMMNNARLSVGIQGVAIAEAATQHALHYAYERKQGRAPGKNDGMSPIVDHPDVKRMLLEMQSKTAAARLICYTTAAALDRANLANDQQAGARSALLTPIAKAFSTDIANEVASLGIQIHGGMGFIEETGAAQFYRDARITAIYEGTNGIQANDLIGRKLMGDKGAAMQREIALIEETAQRIAALNSADFGRTAVELQDCAQSLQRATQFILETSAGSPDIVLAGAVSYLRLAALGIGGAALAEAALTAHRVGEKNPVQSVRFFAEQLVPASSGLERAILHGGEGVAAAELDMA